MKIYSTDKVTKGGLALTSDDQTIRVMMRPGDVKTVSDQMRHSKSIRHAIRLGFIRVEMDETVSDNIEETFSDFVSQIELKELQSQLYSAISSFSGGGEPGTSGYSGFSGTGSGGSGAGTSGYSGISGAPGSGIPVGFQNVINNNYQVLSTDANKIINVTASTTNCTITLPDIATITAGFELIIRRAIESVNLPTRFLVYINRYSSDTINGYTSIKLSGTGEIASLIYNGTGWNLINSNDQAALQIGSISSEPTGFLNRNDSTISFQHDGTLANPRVFTISPASSYFDVYVKGQRFRKTAPETVTIDNTTRMNYIYYNESGVLSQSVDFFNLENVAPVALAYWNASLNEGFACEERHGLAMDWATHLRLHLCDGAKVYTKSPADGFDIFGYHVQSDSILDMGFGINPGTFIDEDINVVVPVLPDDDVYTVYYRTAVGQWTWERTSSLPFIINGSTNWIQYDANGTLTDLSDDQYFNIWVYARPSITINQSIFIILGQNAYSSLDLAQAENVATSLDLTGLPQEELVPLWQVTLRANHIYNVATGHSRIEADPVKLMTQINFGTGKDGTSGFSGTSGKDGDSGFSGTSGDSGHSGYSAFSGYSSNVAGISGYSGQAENPARLYNTMSTGLLTGGEISITDGQPSKVNISGGTGVIVNNYTNPLSPTMQVVTWSGWSAVDLTYLATGTTTVFGIDINGNLLQHNEFVVTDDQRRDEISLGSVGHETNDVITWVANEAVVAIDIGNQLYDFLLNFGNFNITGNNFSANGANLKLDRSDGSTFITGANFQIDKKGPHVVHTDLVTSIPFFYYYTIGDGTWAFSDPAETSINPNLYDTLTGTATVDTDKWTIQTIFYYASMDSVDIQFGQSQFTSKSEAKTALQTAITICPDLAYDTFRAWIVIKQGATDLSDPAQAEIIPAGRLGLYSFSTGGGGGEVNTASNIGVSGIGLYHGKVGVDLQFKNIKAGSSNITITDNTDLNTVDIDVVTTSGYSGIGISGYSGYGESGISGYSAFSGISGYSSQSGISGYSAFSGISGYSSQSGISGYSASSGISGFSSQSGYSAFSGISGFSSQSGISGYSAFSGISGYSSQSGISGYSAISGISGYSSDSGFSGYSAFSGYSSNVAGASGYSGQAENPARLYNTMSTGLLTGGLLTQNTTTTVNVSAGTGIIVNNYTDPLNPTMQTVTWSAKNNVSLTYLATDLQSVLSIDINGDLLQKVGNGTDDQRRDEIILGTVGHEGNTEITWVSNEPTVIIDVANQLYDFLWNFGSFNINGNDYSANGTNLKLNRSEGTTFIAGANYQIDKKGPHVTHTNASTAQQLYYYYTLGDGSWTGTNLLDEIDPNTYDTLTGTATVPDGKWTIQTLFYYASLDSIDVQYGQVLYDSLSAAETAIQQSITISPILQWDTFRAWLVIKKGATDLTNIAEAKIIPGNRLGLYSFGAGGGTGGEVNTASNIGVSGIGLYHNKVGVDLQFKNIKAGSSNVTITDNTDLNTVDIDVVTTSGYSGIGISGYSGLGYSGYSGSIGISGYSGAPGPGGGGYNYMPGGWA